MPAAAAITSVVGGVVSSNAAKKAGNKAADAQTAAAQAGIDEQQRQFAIAQQLLAPYVNAGTQALGGQQNLLGLNGTSAQQDMINQLMNSGQFYELAQQQENALLQNASATGGLRGGNIQAALAQFRPNLLQQMIQNQYANLGGLSTLGQNAATMTGNMGQQTAANVANLYNQQGAARAGAFLNAGQQTGNMVNSIVGGVGSIANIMGGAMGIPTGGGGIPTTTNNVVGGVTV